VNEFLRMHVEPELREPALVIAFDGWNDAGEAATSALEFLNQAINSVPLAEIDPDEFYDFTVRRPTVTPVSESLRRIDWPRNEFRYGSVDCSREIIIAIGVEPHLRWRRYCDAIVELALDMGVAKVILVGAYLADVVYSQPVALTGFSSNPEVLAELGVVASHYQGPTGIVGVLAERLQSEGLFIASLWAGLPHYIEASPNPRGALALIQKLTECLDFRIDVEPLRAEAAEFEQRISKVVAADAELSDYVKRLKRREFAQ
jgi:proteasome assembly chaperone (PAC2) family protein